MSKKINLQIKKREAIVRNPSNPGLKLKEIGFDKSLNDQASTVWIDFSRYLTKTAEGAYSL